MYSRNHSIKTRFRAIAFRLVSHLISGNDKNDKVQYAIHSVVSYGIAAVSLHYLRM